MQQGQDLVIPSVSLKPVVHSNRVFNENRSPQNVFGCSPGDSQPAGHSTVKPGDHKCISKTKLVSLV
jgi:hypothetical protein